MVVPFPGPVVLGYIRKLAKQEPAQANEWTSKQHSLWLFPPASRSLPSVSALMSLNDGLWPEPVRHTYPSILHVGLVSVYNSNNMQLEQS